MTRFDAIIIGAGQAGPSLARRLSAAGMTVAFIERQLFGGTCVNTGCMPTKTLVASAYAAHLAGRLVIAQPQIRRMAKAPVPRHLRERHLRHQARLQPRHAAFPRRIREGSRRPHEPLEAPREVCECASVEPRADLPRIAKPSAIPRPHEQRAEMGAGSRR